MSVEQNLEEIMSARFGKDVRQSIHDAIYDINEVAKDAEYHASSAPTSAQAYANAALAAEQAAQQAKQDAEAAAEQAMSGTPTGYEQLVSDVYSLETEEDTVLVDTPTFTGRVLLDKMYGMSIQNGTPTPSVPVAINSAKANFSNCGKNLIPVSLESLKENNPITAGSWSNNAYTRSGITFTYNSDGTVTANGTATAACFFVYFKGGTRKLYFLRSGERYTMTGTPSNLPASDGYMYLEFPTQVVGESLTFTYNNDFSQITFYIANGATVSNVIFKPMIRLVDVTNADYEPFVNNLVTTDLVLRAIEVTSSDAYNLVKDGKYYVADTLEKIDGGYQIERWVGTKTFNGSEGINWTFGDGIVYSLFNNDDFLGNAIILDVDSANISPFLCNRFAPAKLADITANNGKASIYTYGAGTNKFFVFSKSTFATASDVNTWLSSNNLEIIYARKNPVIETVSNADAQKLLSLKSYDEATYLAQTEDTEGVMVLEYGTTNYATKALSGYVEAEQNSIRLDDLEA